MKNEKTTDNKDSKAKKGYNEKTPAQPEGAFPPAAAHEERKTSIKSNTADKKAKEDQQ